MYSLHQLHFSHADQKKTSPLARHVLIKIVWLSLVTLFLPVLLRVEYHLSLSTIFLMEAMYSLTAIGFMYFHSLRLLGTQGSVMTMIAGVLFFVLNLCILIAAKRRPRLLIFSPLCSWWYVAYFWLWYHSSLSLLAQKSNHFATRNARIESAGVIASMIGPLIGWVLVDSLGVLSVYIISSVFLLISCIPLLRHSKSHTPIKYRPSRHAFQPYVADKTIQHYLYISTIMGYIGFVWTVVWVLILYNFLGSYTKVALISFLSTILLVGWLKYLWKKTDITHTKFLPKLLQFSFVSQWWIRLIAGIMLVSWLFSHVLFLVVDTIHKITYKFNDTYLMTKFYEISDKQKDMKALLDTLWVRECYIHLPRCAICLFFALLVGIFPLHDRLLILPIFFVSLLTPLLIRFMVSVSSHAKHSSPTS